LQNITVIINGNSLAVRVQPIHLSQEIIDFGGGAWRHASFEKASLAGGKGDALIIGIKWNKIWDAASDIVKILSSLGVAEDERESLNMRRSIERLLMAEEPGSSIPRWWQMMNAMKPEQKEPVRSFPRTCVKGPRSLREMPAP
jgi:hypothetical protein